MNKMKIAKITLFMIFIILLLSISNGITKSKYSKEREPLKKTVQQDSLMKTKKEIIEYFENSQIERTRGGGILEDTSPLLLNVPFDFNSSELTKEAKAQLNELGEALQSQALSGIKIKLAGHTDERGDASYNLILSKKRVESVKNYLIRIYYIDESQIYEIGYGESEPIIKNAKTEAEHSVNRRVEISPLDKYEIDDNTFEDRQSENQYKSDNTSSGYGNFEWGIFQIKENGEEKLIDINGNSTLRSNDKYRLFIKPQKTSYVYIYQEDSNGNGAWLFPRAESNLNNPLSNNDNWIPPKNRLFSLDENTGTETIYLLASDKPDYNLEAILNSNNPTRASSDSITSKIQTRSKSKMRGVVGSVKGGINKEFYVTEIKEKNWDFYVEIKFNHK